VAVSAVRADAPRYRQRPSCRPLLNVGILTVWDTESAARNCGERFVARTQTAKPGRLQGHVHLQSNRSTAVNGSLRELERPETELAQTPRLAQAQFYGLPARSDARVCRERGWV